MGKGKTLTYLFYFILNFDIKKYKILLIYW